MLIRSERWFLMPGGGGRMGHKTKRISNSETVMEIWAMRG